jgi:hypothetical protein
MQIPSPTTPVVRWIWRALLSTAALSLVVLVSAALWGLLVLFGDLAGAAGARGVAIVASILWGAAFVTIVALLAWERVTDKNGT